MPGCQGVMVEVGERPTLYRNCKSQDKSGNQPQEAHFDLLGLRGWVRASSSQPFLIQKG